MKFDFVVTNDYAVKKIALTDAQEAFKSGKALPEAKVTLFGKKLPGEVRSDSLGRFKDNLNIFVYIA